MNELNRGGKSSGQNLDKIHDPSMNGWNESNDMVFSFCFLSTTNNDGTRG